MQLSRLSSASGLSREELVRPHKPDLKALTGLRFFAAFGVVVYHFATPLVAGWPLPFLQLAGSGYAAVSFFFFLSGFILSYSYLNREGELQGSRRNFYIARLARIYPAYLLAFLLAAPHNIWSSLQVSAFPIAELKLLISALGLLSLQQAWTPWTAWFWNYPAWSVSVEAFFYLAFPFIVPLISRWRLSTCLRVCGGLWILSLAAPTLLFLVKGTSGAPELNDHLQMAIEFNPLLRLPDFVIGVLLGRAFKLGLEARIPRKRLAWLAFTAIVAVLAFVPGIPHPLLANGLLTPLFACLILGLTKDRGLLSYLLARPVIVKLGEASYGIYILQIPVSYLLEAPPPHHSLMVFAVYVAVLITAALLSLQFVEMPLRSYIRKRFITHEEAKQNALRLRVGLSHGGIRSPRTSSSGSGTPVGGLVS